MKISFVCPNPNLSGGMRTIVRQAEHLSGVGHDVTIITPKWPYYDLKNRIKIRLGLHPSWNPPPVDKEILKRLKTKWIFSKQPFVVKPDDIPNGDLVIGTWWRTIEWLQAAPARCGRKIHFVQGHETFPDQPLERVRKAYLQPIPKIVVSSWLEDIVRDEYGCDEIYRVPNGVDLDLFQPDTEEVTQNPYKLGFIYSPLHCKGMDLCLETIQKLKSVITNLEVEVASTHEIPPEVLIENPWLKVHIRPSQEDLRRIYSRQTAWLFPSRAEGFGLPILESLACGTPVFAFEAGAAREVLSDPKIGRVIPDHSTDKMVDCLAEHLLCKGIHRESYRRACREQSEKWSWKESHHAFVRALEALTGISQKRDVQELARMAS